jgi:sugar fermentation stimulation protein A
MVKAASGSWVGVNTANPSKLVREAFDTRAIQTWQAYDCAQAECKINDESRLDYVFWNSKDLPANTKINAKNLAEIAKQKIKLHFVEIKNTTLAEDKIAIFPDAVTTRGQKHITELMTLTKMGFTVELAFVVQREDCASFKAAEHIDPDYTRLLMGAHKEGLIVSPYLCKLSPGEIILTDSKLNF